MVLLDRLIESFTTLIALKTVWYNDTGFFFQKRNKLPLCPIVCVLCFGGKLPQLLERDLVVPINQGGAQPVLEILV